MKNIVLIGIMGCGKTTVGEQLGNDLNWPFLDVDSRIEREYGPIPDLFIKGEDCFRVAEAQVISECASLHGHVISTGGGVVLRESNMLLLKQNGILFFIDRPIDHIASSIDASRRPLLRNGTNILYDLYEKRLPLYLSYADYHILASGDVQFSVDRIKEILNNNGLLSL